MNHLSSSSSCPLFCVTLRRTGGQQRALAAMHLCASKGGRVRACGQCGWLCWCKPPPARPPPQLRLCQRLLCRPPSPAAQSVPTPHSSPAPQPPPRRSAHDLGSLPSQSATGAWLSATSSTAAFRLLAPPPALAAPARSLLIVFTRKKKKLIVPHANTA